MSPRARRSRAHLARSTVTMAVVLLAWIASVARAQTPPSPPSNPPPSPPPSPPNPPPDETPSSPPASAHPHLSFDVRSINVDSDANFFVSSGGGGDGGGAAAAATCRHGCVDSTTVKLTFCGESRVSWTYCKRGDPATLASGVSDQESADVMERAARAQYLGLIRQLTFEPTAGCRAMLRRWICFEYFNRCNVDETKYMPVCKSTCVAVKKACGEANSAFIECELEYEEQDLGGRTPPTYYTGGTYDENNTYVNTLEGKRTGEYIRGMKPNGENGTAVFEPVSGKCTGAAGVVRATLALALALVTLLALH